MEELNEYCDRCEKPVPVESEGIIPMCEECMEKELKELEIEHYREYVFFKVWDFLDEMCRYADNKVLIDEINKVRKTLQDNN